jgi:hypothetical protein
MPSIPVVHNCARRARDYERACRAPLDDGTATELQHRQIEAQKKVVKKHRDVLDFSGEWAKAGRAMEAARQAALSLAPPASRVASKPSRAPNGHPGALGAGKSPSRVLWGCQIEPLWPWGRSVAKSPPRRCLGPGCCVAVPAPLELRS